MEKRVVLAIALSLLVMISWSALVSRVAPTVPVPVNEQKILQAAPAAAPEPISQPLPEPLKASQPEKKLVLSTEKTEITFGESSAEIKEVIFKTYQGHVFRLKDAFSFVDQKTDFKSREFSQDQAVFVSRDQNKQVIKRFIFHNSNYRIDLEIEVLNLSKIDLAFNPSINLGVLNFAGDPNAVRFQDVLAVTTEKTTHPNGRSTINFENLQILGLRDQYFCVVIQPLSSAYTGFVKKLNPQESEIGLSANNLVIASGQTVKEKFRIYLGPQDLRIISSVKPAYAAVMYHGVFDVIAHFLLQVLDFLQRMVHNWGLAIVILSFLISFLLYPLSLKQMRSMREMQALQPKIDALRQTYKDNPQKLNKEIMELYREHKVNPLGGCLPMLLQIPIFFALYQALIRSVSLKGASFLWIKDLSQPDRLFQISTALPVKDINLLPILMTVVMFIQQKMSMSKINTGSAEQQKIMLILMPGIFLFIFYTMPSGLVLYWLINSSFMLVNQLQVNKKNA